MCMQCGEPACGPQRPISGPQRPIHVRNDRRSPSFGTGGPVTHTYWLRYAIPLYLLVLSSLGCISSGVYAARIDGPGPRSALRPSKTVLFSGRNTQVQLYTHITLMLNSTSQRTSPMVRRVCKVPFPAHCRSPRFRDMPAAADLPNAWSSDGLPALACGMHTTIL